MDAKDAGTACEGRKVTRRRDTRIGIAEAVLELSQRRIAQTQVTRAVQCNGGVGEPFAGFLVIFSRYTSAGHGSGIQRDTCGNTAGADRVVDRSEDPGNRDSAAQQTVLLDSITLLDGLGEIEDLFFAELGQRICRTRRVIIYALTKRDVAAQNAVIHKRSVECGKRRIAGHQAVIGQRGCTAGCRICGGGRVRTGYIVEIGPGRRGRNVLVERENSDRSENLAVVYSGSRSGAVYLCEGAGSVECRTAIVSDASGVGQGRSTASTAALERRGLAGQDAICIFVFTSRDRVEEIGADLHRSTVRCGQHAAVRTDRCAGSLQAENRDVAENGWNVGIGGIDSQGCRSAGPRGCSLLRVAGAQTIFTLFLKSEGRIGAGGDNRDTVANLTGYRGRSIARVGRQRQAATPGIGHVTIAERVHVADADRAGDHCRHIAT